MNQIKKLYELEDEQVGQTIDIFIEGFYFTLSSISKDRDKLRRLFKYALDYDMTYAYLQDGIAIGFLGLADHQKRPIKFDKEVFAQIMGDFAARTSFKAVSAAFEKVKDIGPHDIYIDYIATSPEHRSKGVGTKLIAFVHNTMGYEQIHLETYLKNTRAIALYERLGFKVVKVDKSLAMRVSGYGGLVTMSATAEQMSTI